MNVGDNGTLGLHVYRKQSNITSYLKKNSNHHPARKREIFKTLAHRAIHNYKTEHLWTKRLVVHDKFAAEEVLRLENVKFGMQNRSNRPRLNSPWDIFITDPKFGYPFHHDNPLGTEKYTRILGDGVFKFIDWRFLIVGNFLLHLRFGTSLIPVWPFP